MKLELEPVAPELRKTLVHPDRKATMGVLKFSPDGSKVFVAGYPSGVVQVFDAATGKELRRVNGPRGLRSSSSYAVPSADWKTAYVAVENRKGERVTKDGKSVYVPKYSGEIRVFDLTTGEEKPPLRRPDNGAIATIQWAPDGKRLRTLETVVRLTDAGEQKITSAVYDWDPATGATEKVREGYVYEWRSKDDRWTATASVDYLAQTARLAVMDRKAGKETVLLEGKKMSVQFGGLSPDGRFLVATIFNFDKGQSAELKVWDLGTMKPVPAPDLKDDQFTNLSFAPDGSMLSVSTFQGGTRLIDTATWKERPLPGKDPKDTFQRFTFSADGKRLALVATRYPAGWERSRDPDPLDFPQPRIYLYDLTTSNPPRVMVCPQGFVTRLEFDPTDKWLAAGGTGAVWMFEAGK